MKKTTLFFIACMAFSFLACEGPSPEEQRQAAELDSVPKEEFEDVEAKLTELGLSLPDVAPPAGNYSNAVRVGNLLFLAGKGPSRSDGTYVTGKVGADLTVEEGYQAARYVALAHLAVLKSELGDLNKVRQLVRVDGMVNADPSFTNQPEVMNGYTDLMVTLFGEQRGKPARAAVGMASLPRNIAVEVVLVAEVTD
ncbi:MAG: RidA family protein [Saprospiraceae bacterium]|nr:RidA family protein [Saprospiraceae bacterium]